MKYFQSTIERLLYILIVLLITVNVGEGLFVYRVISHQDAIVKAQGEEVGQLKTILADHTDTLNLINDGFTNLNAKVDCIFKYFNTPGRSSNTTIALTPNEKICDININPTTTTSAPVGSAGSTKSTNN